MPKQKFTDQQFLEQYNKGLNDTEISYVFSVNPTSITRRRWKLDLLPNHRIAINTVTDGKQHLQDTKRQYARQEIETIRLYRQEHRELYRLSSQKTTQRPERIEYMLRYRKPYYESHKERIRDQGKIYREQHKEQIKQRQKVYSRQYYQQHKEQERERGRKYRQTHPDTRDRREYHKRQWAKHKEQIRKRKNKNATYPTTHDITS